MSFTLYFEIFVILYWIAWAFDDSQWYIKFIVAILNPGVVVDADADAEQSVFRIYMIQQLVAMKMFIEFSIRTLEIQHKTFKVGVAVGH